MWSFMKPKPHPPKPPYGCIKDIEAYRKYALAQLEAYYKQICAELANTDPDTLTKITEIVTRYEEVEQRIASALDLMREEIHAMNNPEENPGEINLVLVPVYYPENKNLAFAIKGVE